MQTRPLAITFCGINAHLLALVFHHFLVLIPNACLKKKRGVLHLTGPLGVTKLPVGSMVDNVLGLYLLFPSHSISSLELFGKIP